MNKSIYLFALLILLSVKGYGQIDFSIGTGTSSNGSTTYPTPYGHYYDAMRGQYLYLASDLSAAGMTAGNITAIKYSVSNTYSAGPIPQWTMKIGSTSTTSLSSWISGLTTVISATNYTPASGTNTHTFSSAFYWNGSDNIVVEVCSGDPSATGGSSSCYLYTSNSAVPYTVKSYNASMTFRQDCSGSGCSSSTNSGLNPTWLPNITFSLLPSTSCTAPTLATSNLTSQSIKLNWTATTGAVTYDYAVTTSASWPTSGFTNTAALTATVNGLNPNTNYYAHVRTRCTAPANSGWTSVPFKTNPPCTKPIGLQVRKLAVDSALISFRKLGHATGYSYVVNTDRADPTAGTNTTDSFFSAKQLQEGTKYYIHIRVNCPGGETSDWLLDSFTTLITCRPPKLNVDYQHVDRALVYWEAVPSGVSYEYELSQSPTPLGKGTTIQTNSVMAFPLKPGNVYYFHVRSQCIDQGFHNISDWNTTSFSTFPLSVSNVGKEGQVMDVYPNPAKEVLNIEVKGAPDADATVTITDVTGKVLRVLPLGGKVKHELSLSGFAAGVYTVKYADKTHTEATRITKQ